MQTILIVIHLMIVVALVAVVLLQRSEGGALGVGGGSGFMTGRGQANILTRATAILGTLFFLTSLGLTLLANYGGGNRSVLEGIVPTRGDQPASTVPVNGTVLDQLRRIEDQRAKPGAVPAQASPGQAPRSTRSPSAATPPTASAAAPASPPAPANATPVSKAAPVEPTGIPSEPAARAPSAPVQEAPVPGAPATPNPATGR